MNFSGKPPQLASSKAKTNHGQRPREVNGWLFARAYELRCFLRAIRVGLWMATRILALAPFAIALLPLLHLNIAFSMIAAILENRRKEMDKAWLGMKPGAHLPGAEGRKAAAYAKAANGIAITREDLGSRWTDRLSAAIGKLDVAGVREALARGASASASLDGSAWLTPMRRLALNREMEGSGANQRAQAILDALLAGGATLNADFLLEAMQNSAKHKSEWFFDLAQKQGGMEAIAADNAESMAVLRAAIETLDAAFIGRVFGFNPPWATAVARADLKTLYWPALGRHRFGPHEEINEEIDGLTPLHALARTSDQYLLGDLARGFEKKRNAQSPEWKKDDGERVLRAAMARSVDMLVNCGADLNKPSDCGRTPLHHAMLHGSAVFAAHLLDRGAKAGLRDVNGKTALDLLNETEKTNRETIWREKPNETKAMRELLARATEREEIEAAANLSGRAPKESSARRL
jgi:hypothetical protein